MVCTCSKHLGPLVSAEITGWSSSQLQLSRDNCQMPHSTVLLCLQFQNSTPMTHSLHVGQTLPCAHHECLFSSAIGVMHCLVISNDLEVQWFSHQHSAAMFFPWTPRLQTSLWGLECRQCFPSDEFCIELLLVTFCASVDDCHAHLNVLSWGTCVCIFSLSTKSVLVELCSCCKKQSLCWVFHAG